MVIQKVINDGKIMGIQILGGWIADSQEAFHRPIDKGIL